MIYQIFYSFSGFNLNQDFTEVLKHLVKGQLCRCLDFPYFFVLKNHDEHWRNNGTWHFLSGLSEHLRRLTLILLTLHQPRLDAWDKCSGLVHWEDPTGSEWGIHVNPGLIHVGVWQNPLQCCEVVSLQLMKINEKKNEMHRMSMCYLLRFSLMPSIMTLILNKHRI